MKLVDLLKEIGDASSKPYYYENVVDDENNRVYNFETETFPPTWYEVSLKEIEPEDPFSGDEIKLDVTFGVTNEKGELNFDQVTNKGELYRVMATIVQIVKEDLKNHRYIKTLSFTPSKRKDKDEKSNIRLDLYKRFIETSFPSASITKDESGNVIVNLNKDKK